MMEQEQVLEHFDGWSVIRGVVPIQVPTRGGSFLLPAWRLLIPGFEQFTILIHKSLHFTDEWVIAEGTTGLKMCDSYSIEDAIATCKEFFEAEAITPAWLREKIENSAARLARAHA